MTADMVPVETDSIRIIMNPPEQPVLKTLALGLAGPEILIALVMNEDESLQFTVETGGIPIEDDVMDSYDGLAQVLTMLGEQIAEEVARARS